MKKLTTLTTLFLAFFHVEAISKREVPTYLFAENARPAVIIQLGEQPSELSKPLFQTLVSLIKPELEGLGIKPFDYYNIELTNDFWYSGLNKTLQENKINYLIVISSKRLPPQANKFKKLSAYNEASLHIGHYTHELYHRFLEEGSYVIDEKSNIEEMLKIFSKEVNTIKEKEPLYFDTKMFIPEFVPVAKNIGRIYSDIPKHILKEKLLVIKLDPYDTPDWKELNSKHTDILTAKLKLEFVEIRKNQVDEFKSKGYKFILEPFNEVVFGDDGKGNKGFTTHYYYYIRDIRNEDKYNVGTEGYPSLTEALEGFLWALNQASQGK